MNISTPVSWSKVLKALLAVSCVLLLVGATATANPPLPKLPGQGPGQGGGANQPILGDQEFVQIAPGYLLYAEKFLFQDTTKKSGRAVGHIFIQLPPNYALLGVTFVHADSAEFDVRAGWMVLRGWPEVLMGSTIHRAADATTRMRLTWLGNNRGLTTVGEETLQTLRPGDIKGRVEGDP